MGFEICVANILIGFKKIITKEIAMVVHIIDSLIFEVIKYLIKTDKILKFDVSDVS